MSGALSLLLFAVVYKILGYCAHRASLYLHLYAHVVFKLQSCLIPAEMIDKLTLTFNRTRQAVITKELIEIISGAAAL